MKLQLNIFNYILIKLPWLQNAIIIAKPYWQSSDKYIALTLIITIIILNITSVIMMVLFNSWYSYFYNIIQNYDQHAFYFAIGKFLLLAGVYLILQITSYYLRKLLEIRWRKWLSGYYINLWLDNKAFYKIKFSNTMTDNLDQRISEDINSYIILLLDLSLGFLSAITTLLFFITILWQLSGLLEFNIFHHHIKIYGYMVWSSLLYALIGTYITFKLGKPLIELNYKQQANEANFRYSLVRIREYSENIAFYSGENNEKHNLLQKLHFVIGNFVNIVHRQMRINIFNVSYNQLIIIVPILLAAPRYFKKIIKLGEMMQILNAFDKVQNAFSYFVDSYIILSGFIATINRLIEFQNIINDTDSLSGVVNTIICSTNNRLTNKILELQQVTIKLPNGHSLINNLSLTLNKGDKLLISGDSGSGKTTLLRAIANLWYFVSGQIIIKEDIKRLFITQKPYMLSDLLINSIIYPQTSISDEVNNQYSILKNDIIKILAMCNLQHLTDSLFISNNWGSVLSLGEQQKIAFCRILFNKPDIVFMDEITSALDEKSEAYLYELLIKQLPHITIISVAHRSTIKCWHSRFLNI